MPHLLKTDKSQNEMEVLRAQQGFKAMKVQRYQTGRVIASSTHFFSNTD